MLKTLPKILITIFIFVFIFQLASLIFLLTVPKFSQAQEFKPQIEIPEGEPIIFNKTTKPIATYIKNIYKYALGIVGILATVVMMFGGVLWITAGGNAERIANAKSWLTAALTGLVLALTSYLILYTVNPALVNFRVTSVTDAGDNDNKIKCSEATYNWVCLNTETGTEFSKQGYDCSSSSTNCQGKSKQNCPNGTINECCSNAPCEK